jgi:AraC-like DNA-binding protein/streptogramin lyase
MQKNIVLIISLSLNWVLKVSAQSQCTVTHFDEFSGMAQWYVTQIVQDKQGMMWFATWNGLNRYDGYTFESFKSRVGDDVDMPSDRILNIYLAKDGNLRCYVDNRVFGFCTRTCKFYALTKAEERRMVGMFERMHQRELKFADSGKPNIYKDVYGTEWSISQSGNLKYKDSHTGRFVDYPSDWHGADRMIFRTADREGNAWFTSSYGAFKLSFRRKPYTFLRQKKPYQVRCFYLDRKNRYWITTRDDATVRLYDRDNRLLGYLGGDGRLHTEYTPFISRIYNVLQDSRGTYWLCSKPGGLFRMKETAEGIFKIENFVHDSRNSNSLSDNELYDCIEDRWGRLWIASFNRGINCIPNPQAGKPVFLHQRNGLRLPRNGGQRVRQFHITRQHILMAATTTGLIVADIAPKEARKVEFNLHTRNVHRSHSLSNNATMYVSEDAKHRIYVCTESGGVNQVTSSNLLSKELEFRHFNLSNGFPSDVALSAVPFSQGMLIVSNNQIIRLNPDEKEPGNFESYFSQDKLRFSDATPTILPDGRRIFGLQTGAFTLPSGKIRKSQFVPPIAFTALSVNNGQPDLSVNRLDTLVLNPKERNLFLQFAALEYAADGTILYSFRLGDGDEPWNNIGKDHSVTFLEMAPGRYKLQIRSTNSDGVWVDNTRTLYIIVKPTFWETRWAMLLYILLIGATVWGVFYMRKYIVGLKRRQKELHEDYLALLNSNTAAKPQTTAAGNEHTQPKKKAKMKPEDELFMQRAMKFIEEHLVDPDINIGDMVEATATSRSGLNRKMKSLLGVTPVDFIREARIRRACQALQEGASVNDAAYSCGFSDPKYFGKCFKAEMGMTPTEYKADFFAK